MRFEAGVVPQSRAEPARLHGLLRACSLSNEVWPWTRTVDRIPAATDVGDS
jgi:hypothetical protein